MLYKTILKLNFVIQFCEKKLVESYVSRLYTHNITKSIL